MRTKYANNTTEELLAMTDMILAMADSDVKELVSEMAQRLQEAVDGGAS